VNGLRQRRGEASRYLLVSVVNVINHQGLLILANSGWGWSGGAANVFAAMVAAVPAYLLSRYWVWDVRGRHSLRTEIIPFWSIALIGLLLSTFLAEVADRIFGAGVWVSLASLTAYFLLWVVKFLVLDGLFSRSVAPSQPEPVAGHGR
jgi:putative flippase GtrA